VCLWSQKGGKTFLRTLTSDKASIEQIAGLEVRGELRWDVGLPDKQERVCHPGVLLQHPAMPGWCMERSSAALLRLVWAVIRFSLRSVSAMRIAGHFPDIRGKTPGRV